MRIELRPFRIGGPAADHPGVIRPHLPALGEGRGRWLKENAAVRETGTRKLAQLRGAHRGATAFILGNGPSIQQMDLGPLRHELTIGVNSSFRLYPKVGFVAPYTCFSDRVRWCEAGGDALQESPGSVFVYCDDWEVPTPHTLFAPSDLERVNLVDQRYLLPRAIHRWMFVSNRAGFATYRGLASRNPSYNLLAGACVGNSVIFLAAQLAVHLGCRRVVLIGVDMDYGGPTKHFYGDKNWTPPTDYERDAKPWFLRFRAWMNSRQIEFINATVGGKVDCLPRRPLGELLGAPR